MVFKTQHAFAFFIYTTVGRDIQDIVEPVRQVLPDGVKIKRFIRYTLGQD